MDNEKLNILRLLIEHQEPISIRQIALKRNINYKSAYNAVQKLSKEGTITINPLGNTSLCTFNHNFNESVFIVEHARLQELLRNKNFKVIHNDMKSINSQFIILLFGSYAKNTATAKSDIDFLVRFENGKSTAIVKDETGNIDVLVFKENNLNFTKNSLVEIEGTVQEYQGKNEVIAKRIIT